MRRDWSGFVAVIVIALMISLPWIVGWLFD